MFNEHGFGNVTIEMLTNEIGIARGNLWYHFRTKQDLIEAISEQFTADLLERAKIRPRSADKVVEDFCTFLTAYANELRQYRFLYRDQADYGEHNESFMANIPRLYEETRLQFIDFYQALLDAGYMSFPQDRLTDLSINTVIVVRFGLEYLRESAQLTSQGSGAVKLAFRQYLSLISHCLDAETSATLYQLFE